MAERNSWWKSLTIRKKSNAGSRDSEVVHKECAPEAQPGAEKTAPAAPKPSKDSKENKNNDFISNETYDDLHVESMFNEKTCRRKLRISRSGRFKEKHRIRATLPENNNFYEGNTATGKESFR